MIVRVAVRGLVQGVGFRWFARERAQRLGLSGWVRNDPDGSVEIAVAGDEAKVEEYLAVIQRGPAGARVDDVVRLPTAQLGAITGPFMVVR